MGKNCYVQIESRWFTSYAKTILARWRGICENGKPQGMGALRWWDDGFIRPSVYVGEMKDGVIVPGGEYQQANINSKFGIKQHAFPGEYRKCGDQFGKNYFDPFYCGGGKVVHNFPAGLMKHDLIEMVYDETDGLAIMGVD